MSYIEDKFEEIGMDLETLRTADDSLILYAANLCGITFPNDRDRDEFLFLVREPVIEPITLFEAFKGDAEASEEVSREVLDPEYLNDYEVENSEYHYLYMFRKALSQGLPDGHSWFAKGLIDSGLGPYQKGWDEEAFANALTAYENGESDGAFIYARCLLEGIGTAADGKKGMDIMMKLADGKDSKAGEYIGDCYLRGTYFAADRSKALEWYGKAYEMGSEIAGIKLTRLIEQSGLDGSEKVKKEDEIAGPVKGEHSGKIPASPGRRPNFHIGLEIAGIVLAAALYGITVFFFKIGAGGSNYEPQIELGFFMETLATLGCLAGIFITAVASCALLTFSVFDDFITGGIVGGIAALLEMFTLYAYPVVVTYVRYACIGLAAFFIIMIILKLLGRK